MNVWIVVNHDIESDEILGVFATHELALKTKAEKSQDVGEQEYSERWKTMMFTARHYEACTWVDASLEAWVVQGHDADAARPLHLMDPLDH